MRGTCRALPRLHGLLNRVRRCSDGLPLLLKARPLRARGKDLGLLLPQAVRQLQRFPDVFRVSEAVEIEGDTVEARSEAVAEVLRQLREEVAIEHESRWNKGELHYMKESRDI